MIFFRKQNNSNGEKNIFKNISEIGIVGVFFDKLTSKAICKDIKKECKPQINKNSCY
jgi:hypothetical protein